VARVLPARRAVAVRGRGRAAWGRDSCQALSDHGARARAQLEKHSWDGQWYRRAYFDDGEAFGLCTECGMPDRLATSELGHDRARRRPRAPAQALDSMWAELVSQDLQIVQLFTPPFDHSALDPGYIKGIHQGYVRMPGNTPRRRLGGPGPSFGRPQRAGHDAGIAAQPINHALDPEAVERYKVEPYVLAADVYSQPPHAGRGGWTWYTGSAAWLYRLVHEVIFGIERHVDTLRIEPRVPASWTDFKLHYRYYQTFYHLLFTQAPTHQGPIRLTLDGKLLPDAALTLVNGPARAHRRGALRPPCGRA